MMILVHYMMMMVTMSTRTAAEVPPRLLNQILQQSVLTSL